MAHSKTDDLVSSLLSASRALVGVSAESLSAVEHRVTLSQFRTLVVLWQEQQCTVVGLAGRLAVNPSSAQRQVDRLVSAGLVARAEDPQDRRQLMVTLTEEGQEIVKEVTARRREALGAIVRSIPARQCQQLIAALDAFSAAAGEPAVTEAEALGW